MPIDATELRRLYEAAKGCTCNPSRMPVELCQSCWNKHLLHGVLMASVPEILSALEDRQRLTWMIDASNRGEGWLEDHVWDDAIMGGEPGGEVQGLIRGAIDAARGAK